MRKFYLVLFAAIIAVNISAQKKIAFIGQAATYNTLITDNDGFTYDDDRAAAVWFMETFLPSHSADISGSYFSFTDIAEGDGTILDEFDVIWVQSDGATYTERLAEWPRGTSETNGDTHCVLGENGFVWNGQCTTLQDDFMWKIKQFYRAGKNILLGNFAGKGLEVFGVFDGLTNAWEYRPNQLFGDTTANSANTAAAWGINWSGTTTPALISGITTSSVSCSYASQSIEFLGADTEKKNRALQYNLNYGRIYDDAGGSSSTLSDRRAIFQNTLNAEILMENCDGNEIQGARFNPRQTGDGTIIWYGSGVYDWYAPGTGGNENVKKLTENTLLYLAETSLTVQDIDKQLNIEIYPNPVSALLNIKAQGNTETEIYDTNGRRLFTSSSKSIDVQKLQPGVYMAKIINGNNSTTLKFIKK
ncbi:MAG: DUF4960 domain-containing protein [Bergeyella sp.]